MAYKHAYLNTLLLLHSTFMLSVVKMWQKWEVGGHALNSPGNYIVDHVKSWKNQGIAFLNFCGNLDNMTIMYFRQEPWCSSHNPDQPDRPSIGQNNRCGSDYWWKLPIDQERNTDITWWGRWHQNILPKFQNDPYHLVSSIVIALCSSKKCHFWLWEYANFATVWHASVSLGLFLVCLKICWIIYLNICRSWKCSPITHRKFFFKCFFSPITNAEVEGEKHCTVSMLSWF